MLLRAASAWAQARRLPPWPRDSRVVQAACQQCRRLASTHTRDEKPADKPATGSFLKDAERKVAAVFLGISDATDADLKRVTGQAVERETRMWLPDPAPRWTPRELIGFTKSNAQDFDEDTAPSDVRPASPAHFMGPVSANYYDFLQKLEGLQSSMQREEPPAVAPSIMSSPWKSKADMEVVVGGQLRSNHYRNLISVLNDIIADSRCAYVLEELQQYMRTGAVAPPRAKQHVLDTKGRMYATGRRKRSVARVWVSKGTGRILVNGANVPEYFSRVSDRKTVLEPFLATGTIGQYDVMATIKGGGTTGQCSALRHGIALALQRFDEALRPPLRADRQMGRVKQSLVTRDARKVERKKPGQKKARKKFAWVKR